MTPRASCFVVAAFVAACGRDYGGDPHAGQTALVAPDRAYRLWYLAPPWQLVASSGTRATLRIGQAFVAADATAQSVVALAVDELAGTDPQAYVASALAHAVAAGGMVRAPVGAAAFAAGATGFQGSTETAGVVTRVAATQLADGRAVVLTFTSGNALEQSADVDAMIAAFEPRPPSP